MLKSKCIVRYKLNFIVKFIYNNKKQNNNYKGEEANKNPEKYVHPDQSSTNKDIAIGTDGKAVNMDLWKYVVGENQIMLYGGGRVGSGGSFYPAYCGENTEDGKIEGTMPQYIKPDGYDEFYHVTVMMGTFFNSTSLTEITIPESVTKIERYAFYGWTSSQTIKVKTHASAPTTWNADWNKSCDAIIKWEQ